MKLDLTVLSGVAAAALMTTAVSAADLLKPADPIYSSSLFNFEGLYIGLQGGFAFGGGTDGLVGVVVGNNFALTDGVLAGVEFQGDGYYGSSASWDALGLGRLGGFISDNTLVYGDLGLGLVDGNGVYAFGGGVEMAMTGQLSIRGELQGIGAFGSGPSMARATAGVIWHIN